MVQTQVTAQGWLGSTPEGRRPQIRGWRAGGSLAVASSTPATPPSSATRNCVCFACMICYDLLHFPGFLKSWRAVFFLRKLFMCNDLYRNWPDPASLPRFLRNSERTKALWCYCPSSSCFPKAAQTCYILLHICYVSCYISATCRL